MKEFLQKQKWGVVVTVAFLVVLGGVIARKIPAVYTQATQTKDTQTALFTTQSRTDKRAGQAENTKPEAVAATQGADQGCNIISFYVNSHSFGYEVPTQQVTIEGGVLALVPIEWVIVKMANGQIFTGTVSSAVSDTSNISGRSVTVTLPEIGPNYFTIIAKPKQCEPRELPFMLYLYDSGAVTPNGSGQGCQDPTTMLEITTPANATVTSLPVTVGGIVNGDVTKVEVRIGNKVYTDTTIIAGQWNVTIDNLMPGDNLLDLYAYHSSNDSGCDFVNTGYLIYQPTPVYDPGVKVSCAPSATNEYSCGDILTCTATFSNSPSNQAVQSFIGAAFGLMNATVTQIVSTQGDISCQSVSSGTPQVACEGSIAVNSSSSVTFMVQLSDCVTCQYLPSYIEVYGYLDVNTPTDPNLTNNFSSWTSPFTCS